MRKIVLWFFLSGKRICKHTAFVVLLLAFPVCMLLLQGMEKNEDDGIRIAIYAEEGEWNQNLARKMVGQDGMFRFYIPDSKEALIEDVSTRKAECGYVLPKNLKERLDKGDLTGCITQYTSPATVTDALSEELFFAKMMEVYGPELAGRWSGENLDTEELRANEIQKWVEEKYASYMKDGGTYSFVYETIDSQKIENTQSAVTYPIRGLCAVFLFVMGLFGGATLCEDEQKGLFLRLSGLQKYACQVASLLAPLVLSSGSVLAALLLTGNVQDLGKELFALMGYVGSIMMFSYALTRILRRTQWISSLIPFFLIGSLLFCPIFFDITTWVPELAPISRFFLPWYYMRLF